ncbi:MAG: energy-coupling factor ABC transporter ATP-binding protein [Oscillospiraceae bacterium]|jgi:cobalt/nickel transport system ATP-binding protein|nr:energy-coupling factor ABC transporter ATP-binding protein [Oscillospiraceae bacterium]
MLTARNLTVTYPDGGRGVEDVSFDIESGESVALAGGNGAGKTTLLLALVGILPAKAGSVEVGGLRFSKENRVEYRRAVGLVFQNPDDMLFMPRALDDIMFGPRNLGLSETEARQRAYEVITELGIDHLAERSPLKLSGGEKRMAGLAAVLAMRPSALLLDEPTAFLDPRARRVLIRALERLPQAKLIATHDLAFAGALCSRALLLKEGRLYADGPRDDLFRDERLMDECGLEASLPIPAAGVYWR